MNKTDRDIWLKKYKKNGYDSTNSDPTETMSLADYIYLSKMNNGSNGGYNGGGNVNIPSGVIENKIYKPKSDIPLYSDGHNSPIEAVKQGDQIPTNSIEGDINKINNTEKPDKNKQEKYVFKPTDKEKFLMGQALDHNHSDDDIGFDNRRYIIDIGNGLVKNPNFGKLLPKSVGFPIFDPVTRGVVGGKTVDDITNGVGTGNKSSLIPNGLGSALSNSDINTPSIPNSNNDTIPNNSKKVSFSDIIYKNPNNAIKDNKLLSSLVFLETGSSTPKYNTEGKISSAYGTYQLMPNVVKGIIKKNPNKFKGITMSNWRKPANQDKLYKFLLLRNIKSLQNKNIPITPINIYGAHQQGAKGFSEMFNLKNKDNKFPEKNRSARRKKLITNIYGNKNMKKYKNKTDYELKMEWIKKFKTKMNRFNSKQNNNGDL